MGLSYLFFTTEEYHGNGQAVISAAYFYIAIRNGIKHVCQFDLCLTVHLQSRQFNKIKTD
jgi:hypothetical protein